MERRYLTLKDLCQYAGLTPATVYWLVYERKIPFIKLTGARQSRLRFDRIKIDSWLKKRSTNLEDTAKQNYGKAKFRKRCYKVLFASL